MRHFFCACLIGLLTAGIFIQPVSLQASETQMTGSRLRWPKGPITIYASSSLLQPAPGIPLGSDVFGALERSLKRWEDVADIEFRLRRSDDLSVSPSGPAGDGVSLVTIAPVAENMLLFTKERSKASALTRVFFDRQGRISEADIVLNPTFQFSTDRTFGTYDLESVFTHEIGHLLGLGHSNIGSSVMFDGVPVNTLFEPSDRFGLLSSQDLASIRGLYGAGLSEPDCCGTLNGHLTLPNSNPKRDILIWAQDRKTGAVAQAVAPKNGSFELNGLTYGNYDIFAQFDDLETSFGAFSLGGASVDFGGSKFADKPRDATPVDFRIEAIGIEDQLSRRAVRVQRGVGYSLRVGGRGLDAKGLAFGTTSRFIIVRRGSRSAQAFEGGIPAVTLYLNLDNSIPSGEYSLFAESGGLRRYLVGAISVE